MGKELVQNEKQLVSGIVKAFSKMESAKRGYVNSVIELGERLIEAKEKVPHGQWEKWLKANSELAFGNDQASKFIKIATNKLLVLEFFDSEKSVNSLTKAIADATPEQLEKAEQLKQDELDRIAKAEAEKRERFEAKKPEDALQDDIIEGSFTEVRPEVVKPEAEKIEEPDYEKIELQGAVNILAERNDEVEAELKSMSKVFDANDKLAAAAAEIKKLTALNAGLESQVRGYQTERAELVRTANMWRKKYEKLEKELAK